MRLIKRNTMFEIIFFANYYVWKYVSKICWAVLLRLFGGVPKVKYRNSGSYCLEWPVKITRGTRFHINAGSTEKDSKILLFDFLSLTFQIFSRFVLILKRFLEILSTFIQTDKLFIFSSLLNQKEVHFFRDEPSSSSSNLWPLSSQNHLIEAW